MKLKDFIVVVLVTVGFMGCASLKENIEFSKRADVASFESIFPAGTDKWGFKGFASQEEMIEWYKIALIKANTKGWNIGKGMSGKLTGDIWASQINGTHFASGYYIDTTVNHAIIAYIIIGNGERAILTSKYWVEQGWQFADNRFVPNIEVGEVALTAEYSINFSFSKQTDYLGISEAKEYKPSFDVSGFILDKLASLNSSVKINELMQAVIDVNDQELKKDGTIVTTTVTNDYVEVSFPYKGFTRNGKYQITDLSDTNYWRVWYNYDPVVDYYKDYFEVTEDVLYSFMRAFYVPKVSDLEVQAAISKRNDGKSYNFIGSERNEKLFRIINVKKNYDNAKAVGGRSLK